MKKLTPFFFIVFLLIIGTYFQSWNFCRSFSDDFHIKAFSLTLTIDDLTHTDTSVPIVLVRIFHNKFIVLALEAIHRYTLFLHPVFILQLISPLGFIFLLYGSYKALYKKSWLGRSAVFLVFLFPLVELVLNPPIPFIVKLFIFEIIFLSICFYGLYKFTKKITYGKIASFLLLTIVSIGWIIVFSKEIGQFCLR